MTYRDELTLAMSRLALHEKTVFVGQAVAFPGTGMFGTLSGVPMEKRIELPVAEEMQLGLCTGMSLRGEIPICIYPRINFMMLAMGQLVLHLDKLPLYGQGWSPKVIIRTAVATPEPLDPGEQHLGDYGMALRSMLKTVHVVPLYSKRAIVAAYDHALKRDGSTILIERMECYED